MHYRIKSGIVKSENAAKSTKEASAYLLGLLKQFGQFDQVLDYGCGKLRYAVHLQRQAKKLTLVDSDIQLSRPLDLFGTKTSIREFVRKNWPNTRVLDQREFPSDRRRYDFILCANVLSSIPANRTRLSILRSFAKCLKRNGCCLVICQHTNSYFWSQMRNKSVKKVGDGFVKGDKDSLSFYGLIPPDRLRQLVLDAGLTIEKSWVNDQSCYIVATP